MNHRRSFAVTSLIGFLLTAFCLLPSVFPQTATATLSGTVKDQNGAVVPGATVTVKSGSTGLSRQATTNEAGSFTFPLLSPGSYTVRTEHDGFMVAEIDNIVLNVGDQKALTIPLKTGDIKETVNITGEAPLIDESSQVGTVINRQFVENLPLNGRSFNTLLQLTPGVVIAAPVLFTASTSGQFSIAGQRTDANNFSVDGVSANFGVVATANVGNSGTGSVQAFSALGGTSSLVSADALQEFRIETSSFAPEYGRSPGGQVILTTRSGTNEIHGSVFEYFRNDKLDANNWFANAAGKPRAPERHNDYGGVLGGPIQKDKTFFFLSYEGSRLRIPQAALLTVPSEFARTTASSSIAPFINTYPRPDSRTVTPGLYTANFASSFSNSATLNATSARIDHHFSDRLTLFGRYNYAPSQLVSRPSSANSIQTLLANIQTATFGLTMALHSNMANSVRANFSTETAGTSSVLDSYGGAVPIDPALLVGGTSTSDSLGFLQIGTVSLNVGLGTRNRTRQLNLVDDFSMTTGSHQIKLGGDYRALYLDRNPSRFSTTTISSSVQGFLTTGTASFTPSINLPSQVLGQNFSLYVQDTWKIVPRLSFTYGVRWELAPAASGRNGTRIAAWTNTNDPATVNLAPAGTSLWKTTYGNFSPRLGLAYRITQTGDFILRGGVGLFYDTTFGQAGSVAGLFPNNVFGTASTVSLPISSFVYPVVSTQPPYPTAAGFINDLVLPRSYQWNVALEKSFGSTDVLSATYVGQAGRKLLRNEGLLRPNSNFASFLTLEKNTAWSNYDALQLQYRHRMSAHFQGLASYTWSHSLDNVSDDNLQTISNTVLSGARDYANSSFDVRHSFSAALTYEIPYSGRSNSLKFLTKGWSISPVIVVRSGFPFNAAVLGAAPGGISLRRPNLTGAPVWIPDATAGGGKILNPAAFQVPPAGQQGNEPRNDIKGFGLTQIDLSISRRFKITERFGVQFTADAFNILNHPNFANPSGIFSATSTTTSSSLRSASMLNSGLGGLNSLFQEGGPRSIQLSLRLSF